MRKLVLLTVVVVGGYFVATQQGPLRPFNGNESDQLLADAFARGDSGLWVEGQGEVVRILADDADGDRHQRFVIRLDSGQTLLVAHNIDLAPRVVGLQRGDRVQFKGEYEWNSEGGVLHWTHHDPQGRRGPGWINHGGRTYQ